MKAVERTLALIQQRKGMNLGQRRGRVPRQQLPTLIGVEYRNALMPYLSEARRLLARDVFPEVRAELERQERERVGVRGDIKPKSIRDGIRRVAVELFDHVKPGELEGLASKFGKRTADFQKEQLNRQVRAALGIDLTSIEPGVVADLGSFVHRNVVLIKSIPEQFFSDIETHILDGVTNGIRWESLALDLDERYQVGLNRAELIARDQVGKLFGEVNQARQEGLGVTGYLWRTSNDERVRDEHSAREGEYFAWDDPPEDGIPGEPVQCRCYAEPDFSSILASLDG